MDSNDFERVFKRNNKRLFLIALSFTANQYDAEDILQNSFMKLLKTKSEFENDESKLIAIKVSPSVKPGL